MTIRHVDLKERIAISAAFTPEERDFLLDAINDKVAQQIHAVILEHSPPNYLGRIDHIWMALSVDEGGEGIVGAPLGHNITMPLVAADKRRLDDITALARAIAMRFGKVVRIAKFGSREDVQMFRP